ncbi:MAG: ABC transporter ATP-binding protein [Bifidobacteriaceae bacterium]|nr:ABC transporter ATP-binding protein [Bifidobacteriaceae bacterium]
MLALDGVDADLARGELTAIMGPSGSGKSTLMRCLAGLDAPTSGTIMLNGQEISAMSGRQLTRLRRTQMGFVRQSFNLIPTLTALENITLQLDISRRPPDPAWLENLVEALGLRSRLDHKPSALSLGQCQRVACARALVGRPSVVLADEPTGNLDSVESRYVLDFLRNSADALGQSIILATHDSAVAARAHRVLFLNDGRIVGERRAPTHGAILDALRDLGNRDNA